MEKCMQNGAWAALFDLDGVVFDTESQYSAFWGGIGRKYHPETEHFEDLIKGQTLVQVFGKWFDGQSERQAEIKAALDRFEQEMPYKYVAGVERFLADLRAVGIKTAVVTSSNEAKMQNVYRAHPDFRAKFDRILTAEHFSRSKPAPYCYLLGAQLFGLPAERCVVFEDSFNGLQAGRSAGMKVVGLSTTNPAEAIRPWCDRIVPDFTTLTVEGVRSLLG